MATPSANSEYDDRLEAKILAEVAAMAGSGTATIVIENRTDDPPTPVVGQIWLRTDL